MGRFVEQRVVPFYLQMMDVNAATADYCFLAAVRASGRQVTPDEVTWLLRDDWRPRVMGAWYAVVFDSRELCEVLSASLVSSAGSLTAPPWRRRRPWSLERTHCRHSRPTPAERRPTLT